MRILKLLSTLLLASFLFMGCWGHYPVNQELVSHDQNSGYRYKVVRNKPDPSKPFVLLAFSGGGTRAASFSYGLMEELRLLSIEPRMAVSGSFWRMLKSSPRFLGGVLLLRTMRFIPMSSLKPFQINSYTVILRGH